MIFSGIVLAGGKSSRMGKNKAELLINNKTLISHIANVLENIGANEIIINTNNILDLKDNWLSCSDIIKDLGPIGGIYSSLIKSKNIKNLILPCDSPFVNTELLKKLIKISINYEYSTICYKGDFFPLIAIIDKGIIHRVKQQIDNKNYKVQDLIKECKSVILHIENEKWSENFNPEKVLYNINTVNDYQDIKNEII